ncbi:MAG: DEAD/DEAH box helicase family protein [Gammaproteobacteria bacterium]|nr:DEAD/DEAH box helicase family protein [Gammaproteobacteria bacterium]
MTIIDNINSLLGDDLKASLNSKSKLKIAASCFSIYAFEALKSELSKVDSLEFIFTEPTFIASEATDKHRPQRREFFIPKANRERTLYGSDFEIQLRNKLTQRAIARECADWMRSKATFRSNKSRAQMQQFACVQNGQQDIVYAPLHGFTAVDLGYQPSDATSNIVSRNDDSNTTEVYLQTFRQIWNDPEKLEDVTKIICDHIASIYQENSPERIYFLILFNIFNEFLDDISESVLPDSLTGYQDSQIWNKLFNFQKDAATGIINKLETYNGCILADSVGLGKTFSALAVIKYYELRNDRVLVLCPKKLTASWSGYRNNETTNIFINDRFNFTVLAHTDLSRTSGESSGIRLDRINWGNYDLVVIDESHKFRNNDAYKDKETRYKKLMDKVIRNGVKTKVLMLSATPVNNRFSDLRNQLALAYEGDSDKLSAKLPGKRSVEAIFRQAQIAFNQWTKLPTQKRTAKAILDSLDFDFFQLLDSVTIARSRKHIQKFYDTREIGQFPQRLKPLSFRCALTEREGVPDFNGISAQLSLLKLSIYAPISYLLPSRLSKYEEIYDTQIEGGRRKLRQADREQSLQALMTTNLLKRIESSIEAFRITLSRLHNKHTRELSQIHAFEKTGSGTVADLTERLEELEADDDDFPIEEWESTGGKVRISYADMDLKSWENELNADLAIVEDLLTSMKKIKPEDDTKLLHVQQLILKKIENPVNEGNKKILLFTAFTDTANYLYDNLTTLLQTKGLHTGIVTGAVESKSTLNDRYDFQSLLMLFSPISNDKALLLPNVSSEIDLLIGTDCISEGQNLQDCDYVINYDIHWNPVRIIQRFGRIDRIGSPNNTIQLVNYWPDLSLDEYINLKERVESRMMIADVSATGDDNVLTSESSDVSYRKEQLRRLKDEVIELEELKTGVSITDLGLNDFRMDLLHYINDHDDLELAPKGMHAVVLAQPEMGLEPGVIFTLRNLNDSVNVNQHNRLHPYYLIYVTKDGEIIANHVEVKKLLDLVRTSCKGQSEPITEICRSFNQQTDDGRDMSIYSDLLGAAINSIIDLKDEKDLDSLFTSGKTTALLDHISGLDDFELIAFIVVREG